MVVVLLGQRLLPDRGGETVPPDLSGDARAP